ncbi:MAG TPA: hypothetical protein EYG57_03485 [Planctomycetes bacterium]|nr:hypothetical protein [Planctomycetaceae bacterium]HIM28602.1 hypothetical protein [Planctomycetota bacterium]
MSLDLREYGSASRMNLPASPPFASAPKKKELMASNKPWIDGPKAKDRAIAKMWQGGPCIVIGAVSTAATYYLFDMIWIWTVLIGIAGVFWFVAGLITYITGVE